MPEGLALKRHALYVLVGGLLAMAVVPDLSAAPSNDVAVALFWADNLQFRRELYLLAGVAQDDESHSWETANRYSAGFEIQKRFSTVTRTFASADYQGRWVFRDPGPILQADPMGTDAAAWEYETHNAYVDLYNLAGEPGRFNFRAGYFYQPFGLNTQTDTHGTLLQLSNTRVLDADRDWQAVLHGDLGDALDYQVGYLRGTRSVTDDQHQGGLGVVRFSLNNDWLYLHGLEGGISAVAGERAGARSEIDTIQSRRLGVDARKRMDSTAGPFSLTVEGATGTDEEEPMLSFLAQADWCSPGRHWGSALQYFYFRQDGGDFVESCREDAVLGTLTRYFRNDVGNAALHWVTIGVEQPLRDNDHRHSATWMVQYYRYW